MKACTTIGVGLICLWAMLQRQVQASYSMEETCEYYTGYIANPDLCEGWGYCEDGKLLQNGTCPSGYLYNAATANCDFPANVVCRTNTEDICSKLPTTSGTFVPNPNECNGYCYCQNGKQTACYNCPGDQILDPVEQECVYSSAYQCAADSVCRLVPDYKFVGNPDGCGGFLRCSKGGGIPGTCGGDYIFKPLTGKCGKGVSNCGSGSSTEDNICATIYVEGRKYYSDNETCAGYYGCTDKNGPGTKYTCPFTLHFDQENEECVSPIDVRCEYNRCDNIQLQFVNAPVLGCTEYYSCPNGYNKNNTGYNNCTADYPFFDEVRGGCVKNNPKYPVCADQNGETTTTESDTSTTTKGGTGTTTEGGTGTTTEGSTETTTEGSTETTTEGSTETTTEGSTGD